MERDSSSTKTELVVSNEGRVPLLGVPEVGDAVGLLPVGLLTGLPGTGEVAGGETPLSQVYVDC